jgi:hypothetical protein
MDVSDGAGLKGRRKGLYRMVPLRLHLSLWKRRQLVQLQRLVSQWIWQCAHKGTRHDEFLQVPWVRRIDLLMENHLFRLMF